MIRKVNARKSDEEWMSIIQECRSSGYSDSAFCKRQGIPLRFRDIDWEKRKISNIMKKTKTQITLPMPVEVGNAIYYYLVSGRPEVNSEYIFIRSKAPHGNLTSKVCTMALYRILPDRKQVNGGGFHATRRTFATTLLRNHARIDEVMDALGHRNPTSVMKYLLLDDERSQKCGLSLDSVGISDSVK